MNRLKIQVQTGLLTPGLSGGGHNAGASNHKLSRPAAACNSKTTIIK